MRRRSLIVGVILLAGYLAVLGATVGLRDDHVRPLYDGFTPPPSYRWVEPPSFFSSGNVKPTPVTTTIELGRDGSAAAGVATPDGQFVLNLGRGAIAPKAGATRVKVKISPVAPSTLAPLPPPLRPNGNAYKVVMTYEPDGSRVAQLAHPGTLVMDIPELGDALFRSGTGADWITMDATAVPPRQLSLTSPWSEPGEYVAGTRLPELVGPSGSSSHAVVIGIVVAVLAVLVLVAAFLLVRRRRRVNTP